MPLLPLSPQEERGVPWPLLVDLIALFFLPFFLNPFSIRDLSNMFSLKELMVHQSQGLQELFVFSGQLKNALVGWGRWHGAAWWKRRSHVYRMLAKGMQMRFRMSKDIFKLESGGRKKKSPWVTDSIFCGTELNCLKYCIRRIAWGLLFTQRLLKSFPHCHRFFLNPEILWRCQRVFKQRRRRNQCWNYYFQQGIDSYNKAVATGPPNVKSVNGLYLDNIR